MQATLKQPVTKENHRCQPKPKPDLVVMVYEGALAALHDLSNQCL